MSDSISRQAAIDALIEWYGCEPSDLDYFKEIVEKLPSADRPQGEWIPCSERLPDDKHEECLANVVLEDAPHKVIISNFVAYDYERGWIDAWMPLPEPWKGVDDD